MSGMAEGSVVITHDVGLHARPSVKLTKLAKGFSSTIEIAGAADGPWIDAKSIVKVMAMKARQHSTLFVRATGDDAQAAVDAVRNLVTRDFDDAGNGH
jgi:phosphocarrier protein